MVVKGNWAIFARLALALGVVVAGSSAGLAQDNYPNKPIKMVIGFGAGGSTDRAARLVAEAMSSDLGQQVIVENRTGAGGRIATNLVINAPPDGYTILYTTISQVFMPILYKNLPFDPENGLVPIGMVALMPFVAIVSKDLGVSTYKELIDLLRANPGKYAYGSTGPGTITHISGEQFKGLSKTDVIHVPYPGEPPQLNDLMGGRLAFIMTGPPAIPALQSAGKIVALAITDEVRSDLLPNVPTTAEAGLPGHLSYTFHMVQAPKGTPQPIIDRLNKALNDAVKKVEPQIQQLGMRIMLMNPKEMQAYLAAESKKWRTIIEDAKITVEQ